MFHVPVVHDTAEEHRVVAVGPRLEEHVQRSSVHSIFDAVLGDVATRHLAHHGQLGHAAADIGVALRQGNRKAARAAGHVEQAAYGREVRVAGHRDRGRERQPVHRAHAFFGAL